MSAPSPTGRFPPCNFFATSCIRFSRIFFRRSIWNIPLIRKVRRLDTEGAGGTNRCKPLSSTRSENPVRCCNFATCRILLPGLETFWSLVHLKG